MADPIFVLGTFWGFPIAWVSLCCPPPLVVTLGDFADQGDALCYETSSFISFLDYWQVTLIWSPYGDDSLIRSLLIVLTVTWTYWVSSTSPLLIYSSA